MCCTCSCVLEAFPDPGMVAQVSVLGEEVETPARTKAVEVKAEPAVMRQSSFRAILTRDSALTPWGLVTDSASGTSVYLTDTLEGGPVAKYNDLMPEDKKIKAGDYILSVNGTSSDGVLPEAWSSFVTAFGEELRNSNVVTLHLRRPHIFVSEIKRESSTLGLDLCFGKESDALSIIHMRAGSAQKALPAIHAGDRIVAVNGERGTSARLLEVIQQSEKLTLTMSRPH